MTEAEAEAEKLFEMLAQMELEAKEKKNFKMIVEARRIFKWRKRKQLEKSGASPSLQLFNYEINSTAI